jgi:hypothetical protein
VGLLLLLGAPLPAQDTPADRRLTIGPVLGALIPTGAQRDNFKAATSAGAQVTYRLARQFRAVATGTWSYGHHKFPSAGDRVDIWQYDGGAEFHPCGDCAGDWDLDPFVGLGAGGRTNDYHARGYGSTTCLSGYGAIGAEVQGPSLAVRVEGRDYVSCQESPVSGNKDTMNDVRVSVGIALRL